MGKNFKRLLCGISALAIASSVLLTGCGGKDNGNADGSELKPVELTYYIVGPGEPAAQPEVNAAISEYIKDKINATIKIEMFDYNSYDSKLNSMIAGGEAFDMLFTSAGSMSYATAARKGSFLELGDLLDEYGSGIKDALGQSFLDGAKIDGELYALPTNKEQAHNYGFLLRKDLVDKYNMDVSTIKKLADLEPYLEIVKQNEPNTYPIIARPKQSLWLLYNIEPITGSEYVPGAIAYNDDAAKVINQYETPEFMDMAKVLRSFNEKGYIRKDAATHFESGEDDLYFARFSQLKPGAAEAISNDKTQWVQVDLTDPVSSTVDSTSSMVAISSTSKNPERAMMFLNLLYTDKTLIDMLYYGIEGKHYERVDDNTVSPIVDAGYNNLGNRWRYGNQMLGSLTVTENPEQWDAIKAFNDNAVKLKCQGFSFDPQNVKTEMGACESAYSEFAPLINTGSEDPEVAVPKLVKKLKEAGSDRIIEELNKQYKEFLKKQ